VDEHGYTTCLCNPGKTGKGTKKGNVGKKLVSLEMNFVM
jgi:hypothetical protein